MKQILPLLFLVFIFSDPVSAAIDFQIGSFEKVNDYYSIEAEITGAASGSSYYVQTMFTKPEENAYFGYTWSQKGEWIKYDGSPDKDYIKSNFPVLPSGQKLKFLLKPDSESPKYGGPGNYILKLKRYTGESSSGSYSNGLNIVLSEHAPTPNDTPTPSPTTSPSPTNTTSNTPTSTPTPTTTPTPTRSPTATQITPPTKSPSPNPSVKPSSIAAVPGTPTASVSSKLSPEPSTASANILGEKTDLTDTPTPTPTKTMENNNYSRNETNIYKYTFILGSVIFAISGIWLYLRLKTD